MCFADVNSHAGIQRRRHNCRSLHAMHRSAGEQAGPTLGESLADSASGAIPVISLGQWQ